MCQIYARALKLFLQLSAQSADPDMVVDYVLGSVCVYVCVHPSICVCVMISCERIFKSYGRILGKFLESWAWPRDKVILSWILDSFPLAGRM